MKLKMGGKNEIALIVLTDKKSSSERKLSTIT